MTHTYLVLLALALVLSVASGAPNPPKPKQYYIDYSLQVDLNCKPDQPTRVNQWIDTTDKNNLKFRMRTYGAWCVLPLTFSFMDYYFIATPSQNGNYSMQAYIMIDNIVCLKPKLAENFPIISTVDILSCQSEYVGKNFSTIAQKDCSVFKSAPTETCESNNAGFYTFVDPDTNAPVEFIDRYKIPRPVAEYKTGPESVDGKINHPPDFLCKDLTEHGEKYNTPVDEMMKLFNKIVQLLPIA